MRKRTSGFLQLGLSQDRGDDLRMERLTWLSRNGNGPRFGRMLQLPVAPALANHDPAIRPELPEKLAYCHGRPLSALHPHRRCRREATERLDAAVWVALRSARLLRRPDVIAVAPEQLLHPGVGVRINVRPH